MGHIRGRIALLAVLVVVAGTPAVRPGYASDSVTLNTSDNLGGMGGQLAAPPGTCTAAPGGALGDCTERGEMAVLANGTGTFFSDTTWSDLQSADVPLTENVGTEVGLVTPDGTVIPGGASPTPATDLGTSWIPFTNCFGPYCGHLTRGDVQQFDENGDGVFDDTWIDSNANDVIDNGEIDRTRAEQFSWGVTSLVRDPTDLRSQLGQGNAFPAGVARERVRFALGNASQVNTCDGRLDNADCLDGKISSDTLVTVGDDEFIDDADDAMLNKRDITYWGKCDPDRFDPATNAEFSTQEEGQRALDNCLWWITALPIFPTETIVDDALAFYAANPDAEFFLPNGHQFDQRTIWLDQAVEKNTFSFTPDTQDYAQTLYVAYGFEKIEALDEARYENAWEIRQQDFDPNTAVNGTTNPNDPFTFTAASDGPGRDTYDYAFAVTHESIARARGENNGTEDDPFDTHLVKECYDGLGNASKCDGKTNPTLDPFWNKQWTGGAEEDWNQVFEQVDGDPCLEGCQDSGVGHEVGLVFLTAQSVNGYFETCVNCAPEGTVPFPILTPQPTYMPYESAWNIVPTIFHAF